MRTHTTPKVRRADLLEDQPDHELVEVQFPYSDMYERSINTPVTRAGRVVGQIVGVRSTTKLTTITVRLDKRTLPPDMT